MVLYQVKSKRNKKTSPKFPTLIVCTFFIAILSLIVLQNANAFTTNVVGSVYTVRQSISNSDPLNTQAQVGTGGPSYNAGLAGILFFQLPDLSAYPNILTADLSILLGWARNSGIFGQVPRNFNVDLYSLGTRSVDQIVEPGDYGDGGYVQPGATLLVDNWWTASDNTQIGSTKTIDVSSAVSAAYTNGIPEDNFLTLALYSDIPLNSNIYTTYGFGNPELVLTTTTVPVPAAIWLVGSGLLWLIGLRRYRKHV